MDIDNLLTLIGSAGGCSVEPPAGLPAIVSPHVMPGDLRRFYEACGGVSLWYPSTYGVKIVGPSELVLANPVIVGELCPDDITSKWHIVAHNPNKDYLTIDLSKERVGLCYDSFFDRHGIIGSCPIIATSFTDLLERLWKNRGEYWYWLHDDFESLGDAYDRSGGREVN